MTTKASLSYTKFKFKKNDTILFGRESAGVPEKIHKKIKNKLKIPMKIINAPLILPHRLQSYWQKV